MLKSYNFENQKYPEEEIRNFIKKYPEKCGWDFWHVISWKQELSENFIREFQDKVHWEWVSADQDLSENFIREFRDKVDWNWISLRVELTETFIREFQERVSWVYISASQNLSEKFLIEFIDEIEIGNDEIYGLIDNIKIPEKVKNRIINLKKVQNA